MAGLRIAFGCEARVGKDTSVDYLIQKYGGVKLSFAAALYDILDYAQERCGFRKSKDREFLQWVGTEWGRARDPNVWVNCVLNQLRKLPKDTNVFISDLRFPNEFKVLKKEGFTCVRLIRSVSESQMGSGTKKHASESALLPHPWDVRILNEFSLSELFEMLDIMVSGIVALNSGKRLKPTDLES